MTEHAGVTTFVVGLDPDAVLRRRQLVRRIQWVGGWVSLSMSVIGLGLAVFLALYAGLVRPMAGMWLFGVLIFVSVLPMVVLTTMSLQLTAARQRWYAENGIPAFAVRMSPACLEVGCDGAPGPVVLAWDAVKGFKVRHAFGAPVLDVVLHPGVVLDHPAAKAALQPNKLLKLPGLAPLAALDQPVEAIDQAARHFSGGRTALLR
jgi:hypothetical protein